MIEATSNQVALLCPLLSDKLVRLVMLDKTEHDGRLNPVIPIS
jgi:hypothetical protein